VLRVGPVSQMRSRIRSWGRASLRPEGRGPTRWFGWWTMWWSVGARSGKAVRGDGRRGEEIDILCATAVNTDLETALPRKKIKGGVAELTACGL
jgi:hypothetical protein